MKKHVIKKALLILLSAAALTGCSGGVDQEIRIPIYENKITYNTVNVEKRDLVSTANIGGSIGYAFANKLTAPYKSNLVSINASQYQQLKKDDVIAVFDSSQWDYELLEKRILAENAYAAYQAAPSEITRIDYETAQAELAKIQQVIDSYTIKAPYDCIVTEIARLSPGTEVKAGADVCCVAEADDIYVYTSDNASSFHLGMKVQVKLTGKYHEATVISVPDGSNADIVIRNNNHFDDGTVLSGAVNTGRNAVMSFTPEVLAEVLEETPNAVTAGWCTIRINTAEKYDVIAVPDKAIKKYSGSTYVNILENGQKLRCPVETGDSISGYTVILSGLSAGDKVIVD